MPFNCTDGFTTNEIRSYSEGNKIACPPGGVCYSNYLGLPGEFFMQTFNAVIDL